MNTSRLEFEYRLSKQAKVRGKEIRTDRNVQSTKWHDKQIHRHHTRSACKQQQRLGGVSRLGHLPSCMIWFLSQSQGGRAWLHGHSTFNFASQWPSSCHCCEPGMGSELSQRCEDARWICLARSQVLHYIHGVVGRDDGRYVRGDDISRLCAMEQQSALPLHIDIVHEFERERLNARGNEHSTMFTSGLCSCVLYLRHRRTS